MNPKRRPLTVAIPTSIVGSAAAGTLLAVRGYEPSGSVAAAILLLLVSLVTYFVHPKGIVVFEPWAAKTSQTRRVSWALALGFLMTLAAVLIAFGPR